MLTREEVLKHRVKWIKALEKTVALYQECIKQKSIDPFGEADCTLCILSYDNKPSTHCDSCDYCIHNSPFTTFSHCVDDDGFELIFSALNYTDDVEKLMKERITYLRNIIRKLKHAK